MNPGLKPHRRRPAPAVTPHGWWASRGGGGRIAKPPADGRRSAARSTRWPYRWPYRWPDLLWVLALALAYGLMMRLVMRYLTADGFISIVWVPSGLGLAALLSGGRRLWPGILAGAWIAYLSVGCSPLPALCFALANTLEPLLGAWLLAWGGDFDRTLRHLRDYAQLAAAAAAGAALAALIGVATLAATSPTPEVLVAWRLWWMGNFLSAVVVAPLLLVWRQPPRDWFSTPRILETLALLILAFLCGQTVFLGWFADTLGPVSFGYWEFLFVSWGAVRFGRHGALLVVGLASLQGLVGAVLGVGFFATDGVDTQLANYWFYTLILCATGLSLALLVDGWSRALATARIAQAESRHRLEQTEQARHRLARVVEEQRTTAAALRAERDLRQRYLDTVEAVIVALDRSGRITLVNRKACRLLGYQEQELLGMDWFRFCVPQPASRERVEPAFAHLMDGRTEGVETFENEVLARAGTRRLVAWRNSLLRDPEGRPAGTLSAGEDITERRQAEHRLAEQLAELRRWHRITLGRDTRVVELKQEINSLLAERRRPPRYRSAMLRETLNTRAVPPSPR